MKLINNTAGALADDFFVMKAQQANLALEEKLLKAQLLALGVKVIEGDLGRVVISDIPEAYVTDSAGAVERLEELGEDIPLKLQPATKRFTTNARIADAKVA